MPLKTAVFREARPAQVFVVSLTEKDYISVRKGSQSLRKSGLCRHCIVKQGNPGQAHGRNPFVNQVFVVVDQGGKYEPDYMLSQSLRNVIPASG